MPKPHENRAARERALELLYEAEAKDVHAADVVAALPVPPAPLATELATAVADHREALDHAIGLRAKGWTVARMPAIDRALLRLASAELAFDPGLPAGVPINEAVDLARSYSTDSSGGFVNGVLSALVDDLRGTGPWRGIGRPRVLVVDIDGVVRHWDEGELEATEAALGLEPGQLTSLALAPERVRRAVTGELSDEEWRAEVGRLAAEEFGCDPEAVAAGWAGIGWRVDHDVVDLVRAARGAGVPTACFSNATDRLEADLDSAGLTEAFDVVVNSARIGLAKPESAAFAACIDAVGAEAAECLFVDDRPENVVGALAAGLPAVRFRDAGRLAAVLSRTGLLG